MTDRGSFAGTTTGGDWEESIDSTLECRQVDSTVRTVNAAIGALFRDATGAQTFTFPIAFKVGTIPKIATGGECVTDFSWVINGSVVPTNTTIQIMLVSHVNTATAKSGYTARGFWA